MNALTPKHPLLFPTALGICVGVLMAGLMLIGLRLVGASPVLHKVFFLMHLPAMALMGIWQSLGVAPRGDAAFILFPTSAVAQWALIGFLFGLATSWRRSRRKATAPPESENAP